MHFLQLTLVQLEDYLCAHCPCTFRPVEGDPLVNETIVGFLEHHLIRQVGQKMSGMFQNGDLQDPSGMVTWYGHFQSFSHDKHV